MTSLLVIAGWIGFALLAVAVTAMVESGRMDRIAEQVERLLILPDESDDARYGTLSTATVRDYLRRIEADLRPHVVRAALWLYVEVRREVVKIANFYPPVLWKVFGCVGLVCLGGAIQSAFGH